ncbi:hypothetical protein [Streptacidiphilus cavernicola]|uniref:Uncharacterized protein n=1 Tax=Streptacidiphilus cavernicola TaxID=3342716 RepID=A0ABV6VWP7_9ACTN
MPADARERLLSVDHQLLLAAALLSSAREAGDTREVERLTELIDSRLDRRLRLTGH